MKKMCCLLVLAPLLLAGCGTQETMETVNDVYLQPVSASVQQVLLELPEEAAAPAMESAGTGKLFLCDGYTVTLQTMESGDLDQTLRSVTGFSRQMLSPVETVQGNAKRYDCVWTAAGEGEDQVCRAAVLDDGSYHYVLTVMAGESVAGDLQETFRQLFNSFQLTQNDIGA